MTGDGDDGSVAREGAAPPDPAGGAEPAPWLLRHKVGLPDAIEGYVERPELEGRWALLERRLTVLHAPGGFGKTAVLAQVCRVLRGRGVALPLLDGIAGDPESDAAMREVRPDCASRAEDGADASQDWLLNDRETEVLAPLEGRRGLETGEAPRSSRAG